MKRAILTALALGAVVATFPHESPAVASLAGILTALIVRRLRACLVALAFTARESIRKRRRVAG